jgi:hypothetical protein
MEQENKIWSCRDIVPLWDNLKPSLYQEFREIPSINQLIVEVLIEKGLATEIIKKDK